MERPRRILVANTPRLMREVVLRTLADQPDIEIVGEVTDETEILSRIQATLPDLVVIALDDSEDRPLICDLLLREFPRLRIIAVASRRDRTICYWASVNIHSNDIETSPAGILSAVRNSTSSSRNLMC
jgi:chemotaxis response regulator CheB